MSDIKKVFIIMGSTASGKSALGCVFAHALNTGIINADSMQIYRDLPILTASPTDDEKKEVPHYLYNFVDEKTIFDVNQWLKLVSEQIKQVDFPVLVGGTGLYLSSLINGIAEIPDVDPVVRENVRQMTLEEVAEQVQDCPFTDPQRMRRALEVQLSTGKTLAFFQAQPKRKFVQDVEFKTIFNDCLLQFIEENFTLEYDSETYSIFGLSEDSIKEILKEYIKNKDKITVSLFSKGLTSNIVIKSKKGNELFEKYRREIYNKLSSYIYSVQNLSLDEYINNMLTNNNAKIGLIGDVSINNFLNGLDEKIINENIISSIYLTNKNHIDYLGLNMQYNFNSDYVYQLAVKMLEKTKCEVVLASICNNNSSFIAIGDKKKIDIYKNNFVGNREEILYNISATSKFYLAKKLQLKDYKTIYNFFY